MLDTCFKNEEIDFFFTDKDVYLGHLIDLDSSVKLTLDKHLLKGEGTMKQAEFFDACGMIKFQWKNTSLSEKQKFVDTLCEDLKKEELIAQYSSADNVLITIDDLEKMMLHNKDVDFFSGDPRYSGRLFRCWAEEGSYSQIATGVFTLHVESCGPKISGNAEVIVNISEAFNIFLDTSFLDFSTDVDFIKSCSKLNKMATWFYGANKWDIREWGLVFQKKNNRFCGFLHQKIYSDIPREIYTVKKLNDQLDIEFLFSMGLISVDFHHNSKSHFDSTEYMKNVFESAIGNDFNVNNECINDILWAYMLRGITVPKKRDIAPLSDFNTCFKLNGSDKVLNLEVYKGTYWEKKEAKILKVKFLDDIQYGVFSLRILIGDVAKVVILDFSKLPPKFSLWNRIWDHEAYMVNRKAVNGLVTIDGVDLFVTSCGQPHNGPISICSKTFKKASPNVVPYHRLEVSPLSSVN